MAHNDTTLDDTMTGEIPTIELCPHNDYCGYRISDTGRAHCLQEHEENCHPKILQFYQKFGHLYENGGK